MIKGGVCILDEGNRMNEKSWASLAPLLDHRRYIESIVAGITIKASREFRCAVTMNQDDSTYEIPDYILSRLQPTLQIAFPSKDDELRILRYHFAVRARGPAKLDGGLSAASTFSTVRFLRERWNTGAALRSQEIGTVVRSSNRN